MNIIIGFLIPFLTVMIFHVGTESLINSMDQKSYDYQISDMEKECNTIATLLLSGHTVDEESSQNSSNVEQTEGNSYYTTIENCANNLSGRILVVNSDYLIVADTYELNQGRRFVSPDMIALFKEPGNVSKNLDDNSVEYMMSVYDQDAGKVIDVIIATTSFTNQSELVQFIKNQKWTLLAIEIIVSVFIGLIFILISTRSFIVLQKQLDDMIQGYSKDNKLKEEGFHEFYKLSVDINHLLDKYQELENSRQEFVSNVSHELKTPITSMKVLADSLISMENVPSEIYAEFMQDIVHEIDRENQIITDLLALVRMDKSKSDLNIAATNINELLSMLMKRLLPIAEQRKITMKLTTMRQVIAEVDEVKLSLACNNLIENAIKYNNDGGSVNVSLNADHKFFYIRVKDTGVGIPDDCQDQIFERFFRVDKARSRDTGGTGLGLAITRNVVLLHKGSIRVHSKLGEGTTFTVRIPLNYIG